MNDDMMIDKRTREVCPEVDYTYFKDKFKINLIVSKDHKDIFKSWFVVF